MCVVSLAIIFRFQHKTRPSPAERLVAMPLELVFWALSLRSYPAATATQVARMVQLCQDAEAAPMVPLAKSFNTAGNSPPSLILLHCLDHKKPHDGPLPPNRYSRHEAHSMQHRYLCHEARSPPVRREIAPCCSRHVFLPRHRWHDLPRGHRLPDPPRRPGRASAEWETNFNSPHFLPHTTPSTNKHLRQHASRGSTKIRAGTNHGGST